MDIAESAEEEMKSGCCNLYLMDAILMEASHQPTIKSEEVRYRPQLTSKSLSNLRHSASRSARLLHGVEHRSALQISRISPHVISVETSDNAFSNVPQYLKMCPSQFRDFSSECVPNCLTTEVDSVSKESGSKNQVWKTPESISRAKKDEADRRAFLVRSTGTSNNNGVGRTIRDVRLSNRVSVASHATNCSTLDTGSEQCYKPHSPSFTHSRSHSGKRSLSNRGTHSFMSLKWPTPNVLARTNRNVPYASDSPASSNCAVQDSSISSSFRNESLIYSDTNINESASLITHRPDSECHRSRVESCGVRLVGDHQESHCESRSLSGSSSTSRVSTISGRELKQMASLAFVQADASGKEVDNGYSRCTSEDRNRSTSLRKVEKFSSKTAAVPSNLMELLRDMLQEQIVPQNSDFQRNEKQVEASFSQQSISNLERVHLLFTENYLSNEQPAWERQQTPKIEKSEYRSLSQSKLNSDRISCENLELCSKSLCTENTLSFDKILSIAGGPTFHVSTPNRVSDRVLAPINLDGESTNNPAIKSNTKVNCSDALNNLINESAKGKVLHATRINSAKTSTSDKTNKDHTSDSEENAQSSLYSRYDIESRKIKLHKDHETYPNGRSKSCRSEKFKGYNRNDFSYSNIKLTFEPSPIASSRTSVRQSISSASGQRDYSCCPPPFQFAHESCARGALRPSLIGVQPPSRSHTPDNCSSGPRTQLGVLGQCFRVTNAGTHDRATVMKTQGKRSPEPANEGLMNRLWSRYGAAATKSSNIRVAHKYKPLSSVSDADKEVQTTATIWRNPFNAENNLIDMPGDPCATELESTLNEMRATTSEQKTAISEASTSDSLADHILYAESLCGKSEVQTDFEFADPFKEVPVRLRVRLNEIEALVGSSVRAEAGTSARRRVGLRSCRQSQHRKCSAAVSTPKYDL